MLKLSSGAQEASCQAFESQMLCLAKTSNLFEISVMFLRLTLA